MAQSQRKKYFEQKQGFISPDVNGSIQKGSNDPVRGQSVPKTIAGIGYINQLIKEGHISYDVAKDNFSSFQNRRSMGVDMGDVAPGPQTAQAQASIATATTTLQAGGAAAAPYLSVLTSVAPYIVGAIALYEVVVSYDWNAIFNEIGAGINPLDPNAPKRYFVLKNQPALAAQLTGIGFTPDQAYNVYSQWEAMMVRGGSGDPHFQMQCKFFLLAIPAIVKAIQAKLPYWNPAMHDSTGYNDGNWYSQQFAIYGANAMSSIEADYQAGHLNPDVNYYINNAANYIIGQMTLLPHMNPPNRSIEHNYDASIIQTGLLRGASATTLKTISDFFSSQPPYTDPSSPMAQFFKVIPGSGVTAPKGKGSIIPWLIGAGVVLKALG